MLIQKERTSVKTSYLITNEMLEEAKVEGTSEEVLIRNMKERLFYNTVVKTLLAGLDIIPVRQTKDGILIELEAKMKQFNSKALWS